MKLVRGPWNFDLLQELAHFPHGAHDDQAILENSERSWSRARPYLPAP